MKLALLLSLILSGIQANNNTNVSTMIPVISTPSPTTPHEPLEMDTVKYHVQEDDILQVCMFQSVTGKNLNITKIKNENFMAKVAYKMYLEPFPAVQTCNINVTLVDSIAKVSDDFSGSIRLNNVAKENCISSLPRTFCNKDSMCKKILKCCSNVNKIEVIEGCEHAYGINPCKEIGNTSKCILLTKVDIPINATNPSTYNPWISTTPNSVATTGSQMITFIIAFIVTNILR
jgi:hypothetical protein